MEHLKSNNESKMPQKINGAIMSRLVTVGTSNELSSVSLFVELISA